MVCITVKHFNHLSVIFLFFYIYFLLMIKKYIKVQIKRHLKIRNRLNIC